MNKRYLVISRLKRKALRYKDALEIMKNDDDLSLYLKNSDTYQEKLDNILDRLARVDPLFGGKKQHGL